MKTKEKEIAKRIYISKTVTPTGYEVWKEMKNIGHKLQLITVYKWIRQGWEAERLKNVERINENKLNRVLKKIDNEDANVNHIVMDTILEIKKAISDKKYTDTGTLSSLGQAVASLTKIQQLLEGKPTEIAAIFGDLRLDDIKHIKQAFIFLKEGNTQGLQGIMAQYAHRDEVADKAA